MKRMPLLAFLLLLVLPLGAHADGEDKDAWIRGKLFAPDLILKHQSKLKLTDRQRDSIGAELKRVQAQAAESDWQIMTAGVELQELFDQYPVDGKTVMSKIDRVFDAENRKKRLYIEMLVNIKNLLTPEQVTYLRTVSTE